MLLIGISGYSGLYHRTEEVRNRSPPVAKKLLYLIFWQKRACLCSVPSNRNTAKKQWGGIWNSCNVFHLLILYRESTDFLCGSDPPIACGGILSGDIGGWVHVAGIERIPEKSRFMWICDANFRTHQLYSQHGKKAHGAISTKHFHELQDMSMEVKKEGVVR